MIPTVLTPPKLAAGHSVVRGIHITPFTSTTPNQDHQKVLMSLVSVRNLKIETIEKTELIRPVKPR